MENIFPSLNDGAISAEGGRNLRLVTISGKVALTDNTATARNGIIYAAGD
jgi:hypothetical protein